MARSSVNDRLNALDVGLSTAVRSSVGVGDFDTERDALAADITLCHLLHLLAAMNRVSKDTASYLSKIFRKMQVFFPYFFDFFPNILHRGGKRAIIVNEVRALAGIYTASLTELVREAV